MDLDQLDKESFKTRAIILASFAAVTHWTWFFYYRQFFPMVSDCLTTRLLISFYSAVLVFYIKKHKDISLARLRFFFNAGLWLILINESRLIYNNETESIFWMSFLGIGLICCISVLEFIDFIPMALFTVFFPLLMFYNNPNIAFLYKVNWLVYVSAIFSVCGYLVYSNFNYKNRLKRLHLTTLQNSKLSALGSMAACMAHEINNPLAIIKGKADLLKLRLNEKEVLDKSWLASELQKISSTVDRIARLVKSLKAVSRNSMEDSVEIISLTTIIENTLELSLDKIKLEAVQLTISGHTDYKTKGKESELTQVLLNLINNSLDAIQNLSVKCIDLHISKLGSKIHLKVFDNGPKISSAVQEKLMEPFFTTKAVGKGTGLGLSISKSILESYQGRLFLDTTEKRTCFVMEMQEHT